MQYLRADTNTEVLIGPVVAVGDGFTPVTTLSLSTADEAEIIKYGGATPLTVTSISANGFAAITGADGYYTLDITTGNSDTEGFLTVLINDDSLCLPVRVDFMVVNANVYDSLFAASGTDVLDVNATQVGGTSQTAGDLAALVTTVDTVVDGIQTDLDNATDGLGALSADIATAQADLDTLTGTDGVTLASSQPNTITWGAQIYSVAGATSNITFAGSGTGDVFAFTRSGSGDLFDASYSTSFQAEVNAACDTAMTDYDAATGTELAAVDTKIDTIDANVDLALADTNELQTDLADGGRLDLILDAILAMLDDPRAEPGQGAPAVNADLATKIDYLYKAWRNKSEQTATTYSLYDDAGTTVDQKATVSDDGTTATKGEIATGP